MNTKLLLPLFLLGVTMAFAEDVKKEEKQSGVIGRVKVKGNPVIYRFDSKPIPDAKKKALPWLAVISWKYDGSKSNGMPPKGINERMRALEEALEKSVEAIDICEHAISKTGNNTKEFIYYISDKKVFIDRLNKALVKHKRYPIEINFYKDPKWTELEDAQKLFKK